MYITHHGILPFIDNYMVTGSSTYIRSTGSLIIYCMAQNFNGSKTLWLPLNHLDKS